MVINKVANQDDVEYLSGERGYGGPLHNTQPDWLNKTTSGSGSVFFNNEGMIVDSRSASGDTATVEGLGTNAIRNCTHVLEFFFGSNAATPLSDTFKIGYMQENGGRPSAYLDLQNEQFVYEDQNNTTKRTEPASTIDRKAGAYLRIEWDYQDADFYLKSSNFEESVTIDASRGYKPSQLVYTENTSGGDIIWMTWMRHTYQWR